MLEVTEAARARLAEMLAQEGVPAEAVVRLVCDAKEIALQGDAERPDDETIQHGGRTVLVLDTKTSELLSESTLDIDGPDLYLATSDNRRLGSVIGV